jgi:hypothetical protein
MEFRTAGRPISQLATKLVLSARVWTWKRVDGSWDPLLYFCKSRWVKYNVRRYSCHHFVDYPNCVIFL